ncbi:hypothetical protein Tco_1374969, partial [Tanacetum coccineum]
MVGKIFPDAHNWISRHRSSHTRNMFQIEQVPTSLYRVMKKTQLLAGATSGQGNEPWLAMAAGLPCLSFTVMPVTAGRHGTCQGAWSK